MPENVPNLVIKLYASAINVLIDPMPSTLQHHHKQQQLYGEHHFDRDAIGGAPCTRLTETLSTGGTLCAVPTTLPEPEEHGDGHHDEDGNDEQAADHERRPKVSLLLLGHPLNLLVHALPDARVHGLGVRDATFLHRVVVAWTHTHSWKPASSIVT